MMTGERRVPWDRTDYLSCTLTLNDMARALARSNQYLTDPIRVDVKSDGITLTLRNQFPGSRLSSA